MPKKKGIDGKKIDSSETLERRHFSLPSEAAKVIDQVSDELGIPRSCVVSIAVTKQDKFKKLAVAAGVDLGVVKGPVPEEGQVQDQEQKGEVSIWDEDLF